MVERGVGEYQIKKAEKSRTLIIKCLGNGDWSRYNHIVSQTGLSTATVSKFLKKLEGEGEIEKKMDTTSGEYPYPVSYRLTDKGSEIINKDALKSRIDETPLEYSSMDIKRQDLKVEIETPSIQKIGKKLLSKIGKRDKDANLQFETFSIMSDSKLVKEWKAELEQETYTLWHKQHPDWDSQYLANFTPFFTTSLFANLEESTNINILSSLKLPKKETSKYKPLSIRYHLGLDAEIYSRLVETAILILKKKYQQSNSFQSFIEETKGTSMVITIDLKTDFYRIMENFEKMFSEIAHQITKQ